VEHGVPKRKYTAVLRATLVGGRVVEEMIVEEGWIVALERAGLVGNAERGSTSTRARSAPSRLFRSSNGCAGPRLKEADALHRGAELFDVPYRSGCASAGAPGPQSRPINFMTAFVAAGKSWRRMAVTIAGRAPGRRGRAGRVAAVERVARTARNVRRLS
jgi:hypothetical protein